MASTGPGPAASLERALGGSPALRRGFDEGRREYGDLPLAPTAFAAHVAAAGVRHLRAQEVEPTAERLAEHAGSAALRDLYLAAACEAGSDRAWRTLADRTRRRLEGFAVRRGLSSREAEERVQDLLGDLALPPPRAATRTLLGTYDGSGSLFGWLCVVLLRRIAGAARGRRDASLEAQGPEAVLEARPLAAAAAEPDPADASLASESTARLEDALAPAWDALSDQERLALLFKHHDGLSQRQVAGLLGVGEPRVSRVVAAAVRKLREGLRGVEGACCGPEGADAISRMLARSAPPPRPSPGAAPSRPERPGGGRST